MPQVVSNTRWTNVWEARGGDEDALEQLCAKYRPVVLAYLRKQSVGEEAEDVAQEALVALLGALSGVDPGAGRFRSLVLSITRNKLLHHQRRRGAKKRGAGKVAQLERPDEVVEDARDDDFDREWLGVLLARSLEQLEEEEPTLHAALDAVVIGERSYSELSQELEVSEGALRKRVMRGRRRLAGLLEQEVWTYGKSAVDVDAEVAYLTKLLDPYLR